MHNDKTNINENTQTFDIKNDDNKTLYENADGSDCLFEFKRRCSSVYANIFKVLKWRTYKNSRFVIYVAFLSVLTIFNIYFALLSEYLISAFALIGACFMLYIVINGHKLFINAMKEDEEDSKKDLAVKLSSKSIHILINDEYECIPLNSILTIYKNKKFLLITFKSSNLCPNGVLLELGDYSFNDVNYLLKKNRS